MSITKTVACFILLLIFVAKSSATCGKEMKIFMECWKTATDKSSRVLEAPDIPFDDFQQGISDCFTKNGCQKITLEAQNVKGDALTCLQPIPGEEIDLTGMSDKTKDCIAKLKENVRHKAEACSQTFLGKDFSFPEVKKRSDKHLVDTRFAEEWAHEISQKMLNESICPSSTNINETSTCVNKYFVKIYDNRSCKSLFTVAMEKADFYSDLCKADCFTKLTQPCEDILNTTYPAISNCIFDEKVAKNYDVNFQEFKKCVGSESKLNDDNMKDIVEKVVAFLNFRLSSNIPEDPCDHVNSAPF